MDLTERRTRHGALLQGVIKQDAAAWSRIFLEHLLRSHNSELGSTVELHAAPKASGGSRYG
jgi:hypothetical protein